MQRPRLLPHPVRGHSGGPSGRRLPPRQMPRLHHVGQGGRQKRRRGGGRREKGSGVHGADSVSIVHPCPVLECHPHDNSNPNPNLTSSGPARDSNEVALDYNSGTERPTCRLTSSPTRRPSLPSLIMMMHVMPCLSFLRSSLRLFHPHAKVSKGQWLASSSSVCKTF